MFGWPSRSLSRRLIVLALVVTSLTACASGRLTSARVELANDPVPGETTLNLLVSYDACADGKVPTRVEDVTIAETREVVTLEVFVRLPPRPIWDTDVSCPGSSDSMPFTLELTEPLGDRSLEYVNFENRTREVLVRIRGVAEDPA